MLIFASPFTSPLPDGEAERSALLEESEKHGDDPAAVARRPQAGHALLAERFGGRVPEATMAGPASDIDYGELRALAAAEARRLWERMARL